MATADLWACSWSSSLTRLLRPEPLISAWAAGACGCLERAGVLAPVTTTPKALRGTTFPASPRSSPATLFQHKRCFQLISTVYPSLHLHQELSWLWLLILRLSMSLWLAAGIYASIEGCRSLNLHIALGRGRSRPVYVSSCSIILLSEVIYQIIWRDILLPFALHCGATVSTHNIWPWFLPFECILQGLLEVLWGTDLKQCGRVVRRCTQKVWWEECGGVCPSQSVLDGHCIRELDRKLIQQGFQQPNGRGKAASCIQKWTK